MEQWKTVADSYTEQVHLLFPAHVNGQNRLFGGTLMEWIDVVAAVVARRHCQLEVTTASVDNLQFQAAAYAGSMVLLTGRMTYVGRTSMEVRVDTFHEMLSGRRESINTAYLVMVALNEENRPTPVPRLRLLTAKEEAEWLAGEKRNALRKQRRAENY